MGCEGCYYWRAANSGKRGTGLKFCWYALDNHKCRLQPAEKCTFRITEKEVEALGKIDEGEARRLHADGKSDREIADHFKVTPSGASSWLRRHGLPANGKKEVEKVPAVLKIPSIDALPAEVAEKVKAIMPQEFGLNKPISLSVNPAPAYNDPVIFEALCLAVGRVKEAGGNPYIVWRELLAAVERHIDALSWYVWLNSSDATAHATELAALAAVEEVKNCENI